MSFIFNANTNDVKCKEEKILKKRKEQHLEYYNATSKYIKVNSIIIHCGL